MIRAQSQFTGASQTHPDMRRWRPRGKSADGDLLAERGTLADRSNDLLRNHGVAEGARQTQLDNIVGTGLVLRSRPDYRLLGRDRVWAEEWSTQVEALFSTWADSTDCDAARELNFHGLTAQVFNHGFSEGDGLALPLWLPQPGARYATRLQVIDPARLSNPMEQPDGPTLRGGKVIDRWGGPVGYWIRKAHPSDGLLAPLEDLASWDYVPAVTSWGRARVIHVHDKARSGQSRGKPSLTSVMRQFKVLGDFTNAELKAAVVNAKIALFTESSLNQEGILDLLSNDPEMRDRYKEALAQRGTSSITMDDGQIIPLALGEKISGFAPARPSDAFDPFVTSIFRHIATGLNIPYELLLKDFSRSNYSSARAALNEAWRFFRGRRAWLAAYWATPVFALWLEEAVNLGLVDAPDFYENKLAYCRCRWVGPGRGWVDPAKEADSAVTRRTNLLSTLESECAEQGFDWEENIEQQGAEIKRAMEVEKTLGLPEGSLWRRVAFGTIGDHGAKDYPSDKETPTGTATPPPENGQGDSLP